MSTPDRFRFNYALRNASAELPADCYDEFGRLAKLVQVRPSKFQLLVLDCRDEGLRERVIGNLDEMLRPAGRASVRLRLNDFRSADFPAVERSLVALAGEKDVVHVTGGAAWFDAAGWESFNVRREAVAQQVKASILLWLDAESIAAMARIAIDLWAWRAAVVAFTQVPQPVISAELVPDVRPFDNRALAERTKRIAFLSDALQETELPGEIRFGLAIELGDLWRRIGRLDKAERAYRDIALAAAPSERERAITVGKIADILQARGELDEAVRIRREEQLPVLERLGDVRSYAVNMGKIADILQMRGEVDEALRIRREEQLPVYERLGSTRERAITMGRIADVLAVRGELDEALRIRREEELPVFDRLGDVRSRTITMGKIADILQARGEFDEALRILQDEVIPAFGRLGDVRERAVTMGRIADILQARGQLDEALQIRRQEELPVYERLGGLQERSATLHKMALALSSAGGLQDERAQEITDLFGESYGIARRMQLADGIGYVGMQLAPILARRGERQEAAAMFDAAEAALHTIGDEAAVARLQALRSETLTAAA